MAREIVDGQYCCRHFQCVGKHDKTCRNFVAELTVWLLTIKMDDSRGRTVDQQWVCATRDKAIAILKQWVFEQDQQLNEAPSDDIDAYFATSEDAYQIEKCEVQE